MGRWWQDDSGATAIEYALIAGFIAVAIVATLSILGPETVFGLYNSVATGFAAAGF